MGHLETYGTGPFRESVTVLTDAQFKALPETPIELVPAPASNKFIKPIEMILTWNWATAYDAVSTNLVDNWIGIGWDIHPSPVNYVGVLINSADLGNVLNNVLTGTAELGGDAKIGISWIFDMSMAWASDWFGIATDSVTEQSIYVGRPLVIAAKTVGNAHFTGGNSGNTLKVNVLYRIIEV